MNNEQFRKLLLPKSNQSSTKNGTSEAKGAGSVLGSRQRASIPMTPRSVATSGGVDFARQIAERNRTDRPQKKIKTSVPKGAKLAAGYIDRTKLREDEDQDERLTRIKALEESLKAEEIDQETFESLKSQIIGGDLSTTHLVKGLDFKLLERVKQGEDVFGESNEAPPTDTPDGDFDEELDRVLEKEVEIQTKEKKEKKGQLSTVALTAGKKRTRDQILAEFKASRDAAKANRETLDARFKKIGAIQTPGTRIEVDRKGREVLIIVDQDGHEKRKVRKIQPSDAEEEARQRALMMPDKDAKPLGMDVPEVYKKGEPEEDDSDVNIFDDVGDDYDPLAGLGSGSNSGSDSDSDAESDDEARAAKKASSGGLEQQAKTSPTSPADAPVRRDYFKDSKTGLISTEERKAPSLSDPSIVAALKRAAALNPLPKDDAESKEEKEKQERRRKMLQSVDRDAEDLDMGFGTSRYEDDEDLDDSKIKLSRWGDDADDNTPADRKQGKRGPRKGKRKGDVNSAADVMRVIEQRKQASGSK